MRRPLRLHFLILLCLGSQAWVRAEASPMRFRAMPNPTSELNSIPTPDHGEGLPPGWGFHPISPTGLYPTENGDVSISMDPSTGRILESYREGDVEIREPLVITPDEYNKILSGRTVRRLWNDKTRQTRSVARGQGRGGGLFRVELPVQFPKLIRSIVGDGAPNIEVSGSESITLSGTSDWIASQTIQTERQKQSAFPSLEMKQELNVNLTGSIGDKIKVDVDQSSNVQTSLDNKVKLRYEGDENDMVRSVELGNTNLSVEGASFRQEGLFGIKSVLKMGNVDLTTIASKQQGKTETARFTPSGDNRQVQIHDLDYIRKTYFLISDRPLKYTKGRLQVYRDDGSGTGNSLNVPGLARVDPTISPYDSLSTSPPNPQARGNFHVLQPETDYQIINPWLLSGDLEIPVIKLLTPLGPTEILGVTYEDVTGGVVKQVGTTTAEARTAEDVGLIKPANTLLLKVIKPKFDAFVTDSTGYIDKASPWYHTLFYELRNFYDLGGRDIALETLNLTIRRSLNGNATDPEVVDGKPLLQILGLDQHGSLGSAGQATPPDGRVDDNYIDRVSGILFFPDLHPFAPDSTNPFGFSPPPQPCPGGLGSYNCLDDFGRNTLRVDSSNPANQANPKVYYKNNPDAFADFQFYIDASYKSSQQGFFLGRFDILENSEQVKVDGIPQARDRDYHIDYQTGQLTFVNAPKPDQTITVDFSFSPGLGTSQLTLLGASASYVPGPNLSVTSSILYDSRGAQEKNPKLGEEPARSIIGDLSSVVTFRPVWMTALANAIPGVRTSTPSTLNIQGHAAVSVPNPNTAGEAYVDDMEGNRESNTAALSRTQWFWSSIPRDSLGQPLPNLLGEHARIAWYNPPSSLPNNHPSRVIERDLKPVLKNEEGGDAIHHVLEMNITPPTGQTSIVRSNWTGLTQSLGEGGQDFSKLRFLEIWVNDFTPDHTNTNAKLHIDFGRVSEDAYWDPNKPPNHLLDSEDRNQDEKLDRAPFDEDTGLDGKMDSEEDGYDPATNPDPDGDDYHYDLANAPDDYSKINNFEKNSSGEQNARPDTEDLNHDGFLDENDNYFEATLNLADSNFVAIDVPKDYAGNPKVIGTIKANNGWRLFRVPLTSEAFRRINAGSWESVEHMRLWVDGMSAPIKLQIGGIELVGSRWLAQAISDSLASQGVSLGVSTRNNKDDADVYTSPYQVGNTVGGTATRREQSLALLYAGLAPGDSVIAFKTSPQDRTGLGWTQYSQIRFWVHGPLGVESQNVRAVARFGADTLNYYEYSVPVRSGWQNVIIPMDALSGLKERGQARVKVDSLTAAATGEFYSVVGNPSFTRIYRTSFGVTKYGGSPSREDGEIWINDLRLSGVKRNQGMRGDVAIQANFADVIALNVTHERQDQDFFRVGTGANQGSGLNHSATGFSTTFQVDRLMPTSGLQLPVRFSVQHASDVPKFRTGSDVTLSGARSDLETREQNRQSMDLSYRRSGGRKGLSRFTIDALSGALGITRSNSANPNSRDSSWNFNASTAYELPVGGGGFGFGSKMKINLLPDVISFTTAWVSQRDVSYGRSLEDQTDSLGQPVDSTWLRSDIKTRQLTLGSTSSWTPLSSVRFRYNLVSVRNMLIHQEGFFGFNKGTEIDQRRTMEVNYTPRWLAIFAPNVNLSGRYHESARPELRILGTDPQGLKSIDNGGTARVTATMPIGRFAQKMTRHPNPKSPGGADPIAPLRFVITRLQDIQTTFSFERTSVISRVTGDAGFLFETGFTETASPQLAQVSNSIFSSNRAYTTGANTSVRPFANLTIDARADHRLTFTEGNGFGSRRALSLSLPDLKARWLDLNHLLGLSGSVSSMSMNSGYNLRREEIGPTDGPLDQRVNTTTWQPLLGWDLAWRNGLRANVSTAVMQVRSVDDRSFGVIGDRQSVNTDIRFTKVFPASRGIRFPWSKHPVKLPNDLNLNLTLGMGTDRKVTKRPQFEDIVELDTQRLSVTSGTTYNFTQAISGGFNLGFRQSKDLKTEITTRGITIAFNGQFRF